MFLSSTRHNVRYASIKREYQLQGVPKNITISNYCQTNAFDGKLKSIYSNLIAPFGSITMPQGFR
jgi:hypothetical protein